MKKICMSVCLISIFFLLIPGPAEAKESNVADCLENPANCSEGEQKSLNEVEKNQNDAILEERSTGSLLFDLLKMGFALFLVLGLIYIALKFLNKRNKLFNKVKALENLGGISVGQNKSIQIVRVGNQFYLIGVGENVEMLHEITDDEVKNDLIQKDENSDYQPASFITSIIQSKLNKSKSLESQPQQEFKKLFSKELTKLKQTREQLIREQSHKEDNYE